MGSCKAENSCCPFRNSCKQDLLLHLPAREDRMHGTHEGFAPLFPGLLKDSAAVPVQSAVDPFEALEKYGVAPVIIGGRTFVPVRFVADELGAVTTWDDATKTVTIQAVK